MRAFPSGDPTSFNKPASFNQIVAPHLPAAYRLALWLLRDPAAAEDLVQDAAERSLRHIEGFRGGSERAWVLRIVRNLAMDKLAGRRPTTELDAEMPDHAPSPEEQAIRGEGETQLQAALSRLPPKLRECLVMRELEDMSYREISAVTNVPIGTVMSRLWKARQALLAATEALRA